MADDITESPTACVKIKREVVTTEATSTVTTATTTYERKTPVVARPVTATSGNQQKITTYFKSNKPSEPNPIVEDDARKSPALDEESIKGVFGWTSFDSVHVPYLLRKGVRFAAVRIIEGKLLKRFLQVLPSDVYSCTYIKSYFITENEAKLLNEINIDHCEYQFGYDQFTPKDLVVPLDDAQQFYEFLGTCYYKLLDPNAPQSKQFNRCGFLKMNHVVTPYVLQNNIRYVPLLLFEKDSDGLTAKGRKVDVWECSYLKLCCKLSGLYESLISHDVFVVSVDDVVECCKHSVVCEEWWPPQTKNSGYGAENKTFKLPDSNQTKTSMPNSIFPMPVLVSPPSFYGKNMPICKSTTSKDKTENNGMLTLAHKEQNLSNLTTTPSSYSAAPDTGPILPNSPWSSPQPILYNSHWWSSLGTEASSNLTTSINSTLCLPTVIPGSTFSLDQVLEQATSVLQAKHTDQSQATVPLFLVTTTEANENKQKQVQPENVMQPPPLVRNENSIVNGKSQLPETRSSNAYPNSHHQNMELASHQHASKIKTIERSFAYSSNEQELGNKSTPSSRIMSIQNLTPDLTELQKRLNHPHIESMAVAPNVHQSTLKQTSPKPGNPVPALTSGMASPFIGRPPPPLIPTSGMTQLSYSSTPFNKFITNQPMTFPAVFADTLLVLQDKCQRTNALDFLNALPDQHVSPTEAYKVKTMTVDGKKLHIINRIPYMFTADFVTPLEEIVSTFFPHHPLESCRYVLSEILGIVLHTCNRAQLEALQKKLPKDDGNPTMYSVVINVQDLIQYMPQLKYMFLRHELQSNDADTSVTHQRHAPKRIKL